eukprot:tig00001155_g7328.t1
MLVLRCKLIILGDATVGKSALTQAFHNNHYPKNYVMTVGVDFCVKQVVIPDANTTVELYIFDTAGQPLFRDSAPKYWDNAAWVMLVYDASNPKSFQSLNDWLALCKKVRPNMPGVIVANKTDIEEPGAVKPQQGQDLARQHGFGFFECSAMKGMDGHVDAPFNYVANEFYKQYEAARERYATRVR